MVRVLLRATDAAHPGVGVAGEVLASGGAYPRGTLVMGIGAGAVARHVELSVDQMARIPAGLSLFEAAALPAPLLAALRGLKPLAGETVWIRHASTPVGTLAVQVGKALGCYVIATGARRRLPLLWDLGADRAAVEGDDRPDGVLFDARAHRPVLEAAPGELAAAARFAERLCLVPVVDQILRYPPSQGSQPGAEHVVWELPREPTPRVP